MEIKNKTALVIGSGKSGIASAELLQQMQTKLLVFDGNQKLSPEDVKKKTTAFADAEVYLGSLPEEVAGKIDFAVVSPGVPMDSKEVLFLQEKKVPVIGEIELAYLCNRGEIVAITGTNGKTTTTALTGEIMREQFDSVHVVGNIGIPFTSMALKADEKTVTVAEISSFQLESAYEFHPHVSAILNITPDHLNRHHTMEAYIEAKESITKNQGPEDVCVLNYEDEVLRAFGATCNCKVVYFSSERTLEDGFFYRDGNLYVAEAGKETLLLPVNEMQILGKHNYENAMAAIAMANAMGVPMEKIVKAVKNFQAVEHRIEYVTEKRGVRFYNDSKGTNPDAAIKGIQAMDRPTYLIGGGYDKDSVYEEWIESFDGKVKKLVLIGQTKEKIADTCEKLGFREYVFAETLEEAITICYEHAKSGEAVLLSPACASWGMFDNYEQRGNIFKEFVRSLGES